MLFILSVLGLRRLGLDVRMYDLRNSFQRKRAGYHKDLSSCPFIQDLELGIYILSKWEVRSGDILQEGW